MFGFDVRRTGALPDLRLPPPFDRVWTARAGSLLEFPPVIAYGRLYVGTNRGLVLAFDAETGKEVWRRNTRRCIAAAPAVDDGVVYVSLMDTSPCAVHDETEPGFVIAFDAETGERLWRFQTGVNESSPLLVDGILYFGTWDGSVYALDASSRRPLWTFETSDKVKGGAAFARGTIFVGSYDGNLYALDAETGEERWSASPGSAVYATPAVSGGRVYVGATGGGVYAYDVEDGSLAWSQGTGDAVYSSAAVSRGTVFVGSYDGNLYALNAATGEVRWTFAAGGPISGSPTVIGGVVYVSTLEGRTWGLRVSNGKQRFSYPAGQYTPVVADEERIYLTGYSRVYALEPAR
jgi:outer membrane protein assembly factor BamB